MEENKTFKLFFFSHSLLNHKLFPLGKLYLPHLESYPRPLAELRHLKSKLHIAIY